MMAMIDTHKAIKLLTAGKTFTKAQAEKLVGVIAENDSNAATKKDLLTLEKSLKSEVTVARKDIDLLRQEFQNSLYKVAIIMTGVILAAIKYL